MTVANRGNADGRLVPAVTRAVRQAIVIVLAASSLCPSVSEASAVTAAIDAVFANSATSAPGCAVGIEQDGVTTERAFGKADLEHRIENRPETIFEAGSVSKQFTAAAILLLAQDGKLSLGDDIRRYLPELPSYGQPITIDDMLHHVAGLRDWGEIEDVAGWSRGERVYSLGSVLALMASQKALNFAPGTQFSYSNSGYNLAAIIVERVSGQTLAQFSQARIFAPLGMRHSQWRDNFRRVVPDRAIAYGSGDAGYEQDMPFEDAYGNGGLLTTVGDLLLWNRALSENRLGKFLSTELSRPGRLKDGLPIDYARGLYDGQYRGVREIAHSGATAGYRAWLGRYPDKRLSVALLCNDGDRNPTTIAHDLADKIMFGSPWLSPLTAAEVEGLGAYAGWFAEDGSGEPLQIVRDGNRLRAQPGPIIQKGPEGNLVLGTRILAFDADGLTLAQGRTVARYQRVPAYLPSQADLAALVGTFRSEEADATYVLRLVGGALELRSRQRPDVAFTLTPAYRGAFTFGNETLRPILDREGRVTTLRVSSTRLWDLRLDRVP